MCVTNVPPPSEQGEKHDKLLRLLQAPCFYDINQV